MTRIAISTRRAAGLMLENGINEDALVKTLNDIKQPAFGYYYVSDVMDRIRSSRGR